MKLEGHHNKEDNKVEAMWKDLLIPGLAPLSTPFFPKEKSLINFKNYSLNPSSGKLSVVAFVEEVLAQRLASVIFS